MMAEIITDVKKLSVKCEPVQDLVEEGLFIADKLNLALKASVIPGIGLAANQIGINKRVFVMAVPYYQGINLGYTFINPTITHLEDPILANEGCLSFPGKAVKTFRYNKICVKDDLQPEGRWFKGLPAVCVQHENDHLDGLTMYDARLSKLKKHDKCKCGSGKKFNKCCLPLLEV